MTTTREFHFRVSGRNSSAKHSSKSEVMLLMFRYVQNIIVTALTTKRDNVHIGLQIS